MLVKYSSNDHDSFINGIAEVRRRRLLVLVKYSSNDDSFIHGMAEVRRVPSLL